MPTDTLYGIVCDAANTEAVQKLYAIKQREQKPGTVIAANIGQLAELGIKARYLKAVERFWPGPISIVVPCDDRLAYLHMGKRSLAVRVPDVPDINALLQKTGPLLTSSANMPGEPPANTVAEAERYFANQVDFYVDGGDMSGHEPSTVIRIVDDAIEVLRPGAVRIDENGKISKDGEPA